VRWRFPAVHTVSSHRGNTYAAPSRHKVEMPARAASRRYVKGGGSRALARPPRGIAIARLSAPHCQGGELEL
jgi:hypothetical protein